MLQSAQLRAIVNTVLALLGSCVSTFAASAFVDNRFNIMHVQVPPSACASQMTGRHSCPSDAALTTCNHQLSEPAITHSVHC